MKLRVVAWGDYDDDLPCGDNGWAARNAIIDDIRKNGYDFTGWNHQESWNCTPILNDGKKYCYSQRGWGDLMAEAHGCMGAMDYVGYMMPYDFFNDIEGEDDDDDIEDKTHRPDLFNSGEPVVETDLNEAFEVEVDQAQFDGAAKGEVQFADYSKLRYIYTGDSLTLVNGDRRATYSVADAERIHVNDGKSKKDEPTLILSVKVVPQ